MQGLTKATGVNLDKEIQEGKDQLKMAGTGLTAGASLFTNKRLDLDLAGGYAGATKRGKEYREALAEQYLVTGQAAEEMDKKAKIWQREFDDAKGKAEEAARLSGQSFKAEEFKRAYEAGEKYTVGNQTFLGQKKLLTAKRRK